MSEHGPFWTQQLFAEPLGSRLHKVQGRAAHFERKIYNILAGNHLNGLYAKSWKHTLGLQASE